MSQVFKVPWRLRDDELDDMWLLDPSTLHPSYLDPSSASIFFLRQVHQDGSVMLIFPLQK